jgi:hypothetical protein
MLFALFWLTGCWGAILTSPRFTALSKFLRFRNTLHNFKVNLPRHLYEHKVGRFSRTSGCRAFSRASEEITSTHTAQTSTTINESRTKLQVSGS